MTRSNLNSRFRRSYDKSTSTYRISFRGLNKSQSDILCSLFSTLESNGISLEYYDGITLPYLEVRAVVPLVPSVRGFLCIPNMELTDIVRHFRNTFGNRNPLVDNLGNSLSKLSTYG